MKPTFKARKRAQAIAVFTNLFAASINAYSSDNGLIRIEADAAPSIEAAVEGGVAKLSARPAYSGGLLRVRGYDLPVVVDLETLNGMDRRRPLLRDHNKQKIAGHVQYSTDGKTLNADGDFVDTIDATEVLSLAKSGFPWAVSIGVRPGFLQPIAAGKSVTVNGQTFTGPILVARKGHTDELSMVSVGADKEANALIAATDSSEDEVTTPAGEVGAVTASIRAERKRQSEIAAIVDGAIADGADLDKVEAMATKAIESKWTVERFELELLRGTRATHAAGRRGPATPSADLIEAALCRSGGYSTEQLEASFDERTLQASEDAFKQGLSLRECLFMAARAKGYTSNSYSDIKAIFRHAFDDRIEASMPSTFSVPGILSNVANKSLKLGFDNYESSWRQIAAVDSVRDFKERPSYGLTGSFEFRPLAPGGKIDNATFGEIAYGNKAGTYAIMGGIDRTTLVNDDLGALTQVPRKMGRGSAIAFNKVFWTAFLANSSFFTSGRNNLLTGSGSALSITSLSAAVLAFMDQKDPDGNPVGVMPRKLLVPNALVTLGSTLMRSAEVREDGNSGKTVYVVSNPHAGAFELVSSSYLGTAFGLSGASQTAHYLLASPDDLPTIEVVFLNGQDAPFIETSNADFDTLGVQLRGYHDFGVRLQEYRGGVKSAGA